LATATVFHAAVPDLIPDELAPLLAGHVSPARPKAFEPGDRQLMHGCGGSICVGADNIFKRLVTQGAGFNLALIMRSRYGIGTPRGLQGRSVSSLRFHHDATMLLSGRSAAIHRLISTVQSIRLRLFRVLPMSIFAQ
jgi:hypothetical protein